MGAALVLNATYEPLCVVPLRRAVVLVLAEKAVIVEACDDVMHSERLSLPVPTVVRLSRFVRVPYRREVPLTRRAVLERDAHACVYCGHRADTIDHVRPRSRGGSHVWTNVVSACAGPVAPSAAAAMIAAASVRPLSVITASLPSAPNPKFARIARQERLRTSGSKGALES